MEQKEKKAAASWSGKKKAGVVVAAVVVIYALISIFFSFSFFPGDRDQRYACGFRSVGKVKEMIREGVDAYSITITEREGRQEKVNSSQVGLAFTDDGKLEQIKAEQKPYAWITFPFIKKEYPDGVTLKVDENAYDETFHSLDAFDAELVTAPVDAWSRYNKETNSYDIVEEIYGNTVKEEEFYQALKEAILRQDGVIDIEKAGCYENPVYKKDSEEILQSNDTLNRYVSSDIIYDFDDRTQELTGKTIHKWLSVTKKFKVRVDEEKAANMWKNWQKNMTRWG